MAKIVEVIYTTTTRGNGTPESVSRIVHQLFSKNGVLVAEHDPINSHGSWIEFGADSFDKVKE